MSLNKSWHDYSESLIERGRILIDVSFLKSSNKESTQFIGRVHKESTQFIGLSNTSHIIKYNLI
jgi:hypothetical protein